MSATEQTTEQLAGVTVGTPRLELYETAMCCETGVCGPSVDEQLLSIREDLRWAQAQGASVARHNLISNPDAFVANPKVTGLVQAFGDKALPVLVIDGEITSYGHYPSRNELAAALNATDAAAAEPVAEAKSSGCCSPGTSC
jgi:arsenite-transporting ATPase